jgi:hypothetical protein
VQNSSLRPSLGFLLATATWLYSAHAGAQQSDGAEKSSASVRTPTSAGSIGLHALLASEKAIPGVSLRGGKGLFWAAFEGSFVFLTDPPPERSAFLGNHLGAFFMLRPLATARLELEGGVGLDYYPLLGIHADEWQLALAARVAGHVRLFENVGAFATARAYPLSTSGLELGAYRDTTRGLPVMFGIGAEYWL